ncbi:hypothetical protein P3T23_009281 [Paraburkholderia sp. GAS448]|uniref:shufflon system plasmid conjugative transfer pilus tip adhesin PilV n=1 Tax=Paraburkholderia sp. GAS448 TaxID=3035136 RepID=UPI003D1C1264
MDEVLGVLLAVIAGMMFIPKIENGIATERHTMTDVTTAQQQRQWVSAVSNYVSQNMTTLEGSVGTTPTILNVATVKAANVGLPTGFSGTNPFNQTWTSAVTQPSAGNLQVLIYATGGTVIKDQELGAIARAAEGVGGMIPSNNSGVYSGGPTNAYGSSGAWQVPTAGYAVMGGSPASLLNFNNGTLTSNFLYRNAVPGQPQLNTLSTNLNMGGNTITNAQQIQLAAGNGVQVGSSYYYGDGANSAIRQNGALYVQNLAGTGPADIASVRNITSTGSLTLTTNGGAVQGSGQVEVNAAGGGLYLNPWSAFPTVVGGGGGSGQLVVTGATTAQNVVNLAATAWAGWGCGQNGITTDPNGTLLSCQGGVWTSAGGQAWRCIQYDSYWASGILQDHYFSFFNSPSNVSYGSEGNGWMVSCLYS